MSISRGQQRPEENFEEITYSPTAGWNRRAGLVGPKAGLKAMLQELSDRGLSFSYSCDQSPLGAIRFETPGNPEGGETAEVPTPTWEYFANSAAIDLLSADVPLTQGLTIALANAIRSGVENQTIPAEVQANANALACLDLYVAGHQSFRINAPSLRRSMLVSSSYGIRASISNVGRIYSTDTLNTVEAIPGSILFTLPTTGVSFERTGITLNYGWYKNHPNIQQAGGNKWNISQEWEWGLWPLASYGARL